MFKTTLALFVCLGVASATPITVNYMSGNLGQGSGQNQIAKTIGDETVTATAWGITGPNNTFQWGTLGQYSGLGLGVCDQAEPNCGAPQHEVDDNGKMDFVLFTFSQAVTSVSVTITPVCNCDTNASYIVGNAINPANMSLAQLPAVQNSTEASKDTTRTVILTGLGNGVTSVLFGASVSGSNNYFKIESLQYTEGSATPEPATLALSGLALVGLAVIKRKRFSGR